MYRLAFTAFILLAFTAGSASTQNIVGEFNNWALFTTKEAGKKICYITSSPIKKKGTFKKRGNPYVMVTYRGKGTVTETAVGAGFSYKKDSEAELSINGKKTFKFFTSEKTAELAWAKNEQMEKDVADALKNGAKLIVKSTSSKDTTAEDTYTLKGFGAAFKKMTETCK